MYLILFSLYQTIALPLLTGACLALTALAGCTSNSYMGISLAPGAADASLQSLAARAQAGDKQAQLELRIAFEEGHGVGRDLSTARELYGQSSAGSGGAIWLYVPPSGRGESGGSFRRA
jgi:TPR repeat protein